METIDNTTPGAQANDRRPVASRATRWAHRSADILARAGISANAVSAASVLFGLIGFGCMAGLAMTSRPLTAIVLCLAAAAAMVGRLLCNLLDGMVADALGSHSPVGAIYNELPDRITDSLFLLGAGIGCHTLPGGMHLAWAGALLACGTAYIRLLGRTLGAPMFFSGPMAKQHRMAALILGVLCGAAVAPWGWTALPLYTALCIITLGSLVTCVRRTIQTADALRGPT